MNDLEKELPKKEISDLLDKEPYKAPEEPKHHTTRKLGRVFFINTKEMILSHSDFPFLGFTLNGDLMTNNGLISESYYFFDRYLFTLDTGEDVYENDIVLGGRYTAIMKVSNHHGSYEISYADVNDTQFYYSNRSDFPTITKVLGNKHQNPELMELVKNNPQPFPEEDKVEFIDFSLPENDTLEMDHMTEHLIKQELQMFSMIGKILTQDDIDWLSKRRGFNVNQKNFLIRILRMDPIGKDLKFDTTHESIKK